LEIRLITKCYEDGNFKQRLLSTPKSVIEDELGVALPKALKISVIEPSENTIYMILPCNPYGSLSEEELKTSLGLTYEDVAEWCFEQQSCVLLDAEKGSKIIARAWKDSEFKQRLLSDFEGVIHQKELSIKVPEGSKLCVLEESSESCYILLPKLTDIFSEASEIPMPEDAENALVIAAGSELACSVTCVILTCIVVTVASEPDPNNPTINNP
jgi:hypothetical protein